MKYHYIQPQQKYNIYKKKTKRYIILSKQDRKDFINDFFFK